MAEVVYLLAALAGVVTAAYAFHRRFAPKVRQSGAKRAPYACGESLPPERVPVGAVLYKYICFFVVVDVTAMLLAFAMLPLPPTERAAVRGLVLAYCASLVAVLVSAVR